MDITYHTENLDRRLYDNAIYSYLKTILTKEQYKQFSYFLQIDVYPAEKSVEFFDIKKDKLKPSGVTNKYHLTLYLTDEKTTWKDPLMAVFKENMSVIIHELLHALCYGFSPVIRIPNKYNSYYGKKGDIGWYYTVKVHDLFTGRRTIGHKFNYWFIDGWKLRKRTIYYSGLNHILLDLKYPDSRINLYYRNL